MELLLVVLSFIAFSNKQLIFIDLSDIFICFLSIQLYLPPPSLLICRKNRGKTYS